MSVINADLSAVFGNNFDPKTSSLRLTKKDIPELEFVPENSYEVEWNENLQNYRETGWHTVVRVKDGN
jgi:hypothetical protein